MPRTRSDFPMPINKVFTRIIRIDNQNTLSKQTYEYLKTLVPGQCQFISQEDFITMWKHLILRRCEDVIRFWQNSKPVFPMSCSNLKIPAPLYDLLDAIGEYYSRVRGSIYHIDLPPRGPERWWECDDALENKWRSMGWFLDSKYTMKPFPNYEDIENRPLILTTQKKSGHDIEVRMFTNEPQPKDRFVCFVNDEIFEDNGHINFDNSFLSLDIGRSHKYSYVQSYKIYSNNHSSSSD